VPDEGYPARRREAGGDRPVTSNRRERRERLEFASCLRQKVTHESERIYRRIVQIRAGSSIDG
jgi:hypothetical protein